MNRIDTARAAGLRDERTQPLVALRELLPFAPGDDPEGTADERLLGRIERKDEAK